MPKPSSAEGHALIHHTVFLVGDCSHCVWGDTIAEINRCYLEGIDPEYYDYLAVTHHKHLRLKKDRQRAALALRTYYHHGLETLFSLASALLQAPAAVPAWMQLCGTDTLPKIVGEIQRGTFVRTMLPMRRVSWRSIATFVHQWDGAPPERKADTVEHFSRVWSRFASDFLDLHRIGEYNGIKHGLRVRSGGFGLRVGVEHTYGVAPPDDEMRQLVQSDFGSSYFEVEPIVKGASPRSLHTKYVDQSQNWDPTAMACAIRLVAMSVNNFRSCLLAMNGQEARTVKFTRPQDSSFFDQIDFNRPSVGRMNFSSLIDLRRIKTYSRRQLSQLLREHRNKLLARQERTIGSADSTQLPDAE